MIKMTVLTHILHIVIPPEMISEAPLLLKTIWNDKFVNMLDFQLNLAELPGGFLKEAQLNPSILVCEGNLAYTNELSLWY